MAKESRVYLSGYSLEEIHELLEGGFLDNNVDFNKELVAVTSTEKNGEKKKVFKCTVYGKGCVSSQGLKKHNPETCPGRNYTKRTDEFMSIVKKCADSCNEDLCLPKDTETFFHFLILPLTMLLNCGQF